MSFIKLIKLLARAVVSTEGLIGEEEICLRSLTWLLADFSPWTNKLFHGAASQHGSWLFPSTWQLAFPLNMAPGLVSNPGELRELSQDERASIFQSFYNLILEVTSYHFFHILFVRIESVSIAHVQEERITQSPEYREARILGAILVADNHNHLHKRWPLETLCTHTALWTWDKEGRTKILFKKTKLIYTHTNYLW